MAGGASGDVLDDIDAPDRSPRPSRPRLVTRTRALLGSAVMTGLLAGALPASAQLPPGPTGIAREARTLDGSGNIRRHPTWGQAGGAYLRLARAAYADGVAAMVEGPGARYVSNRVFNDTGQNLFSARGVTQWGWTWGQFLDHTIGLAAGGTESDPVAHDAADPLEGFANDLGTIAFRRDAAAAGTGTTSPRQHVNTVSSWIDAFAVYGGTEDRLEWLREGPVNGDLADNGPHLLLTADGYLPTVTARGDAATAPAMQRPGRLAGAPDQAVVAGDVRANENIALTATQTLFAREHNRIVDALPSSLSDRRRFDLARRVVGAEVQWITYTQFLPALGVDLPRYQGYRPQVNATLGTEFATVGYRAHSMIHGELEPTVPADRFTAGELARFEAQGITVTPDGDEVALTVPLNVAFANPGLVEGLGLDAVLASLSAERQYANDEQIDNQLRSVLFQVPRSGADPAACGDQDDLTQCFRGVVDLGALDLQRARDHGIASYNDLRAAFGLPRLRTFTQVTGERTDRFPADPAIDAADPLDDPDILDIVELRDADGQVLAPGSDAAAETAVRAVRRSTLAARLRALYGSPDRMDAFVGMMAERHLRGSELGPLQAAMWQRQFTALRDGDRFFFANDPALAQVRARYGIDFRVDLGDLVAEHTGLDRPALPADLFLEG